MNVSRYSKFIAAVVAAVAVVGVHATDGRFTPSEAIESVLAFLGALGVYVVPNTPGPVAEHE